MNILYEANYSLHRKDHTTRKVQFLFLLSFLLVLTKLSFCLEEWVLGNNL